ncbi:MAG TPA: hypothetical protein VNG31_10280 [Candidatus Baltobacteraceae bacterium]|nr:hypothetical protein [Candidatus Baltobacteraceae bacterium]
MLLDIGIDSMFVNASTPSPITSIQVVSPQQSAPVLSYSFAYPVTAGATPPAPNPSASPPIIFLAPSPPAFVNTGRNALAAANYFYDAGCGTVGFGSPAPSP